MATEDMNDENQRSSHEAFAVAPGSATGCAAECANRGIKVGDVIIGREGPGEEAPGGWWQEERMELLWLGQRVAVWRCWTRTNREPGWRYDGEMSNWTLTCREWRRVESPNGSSSATPHGH